ncbi:MAG: diaminopimelate decarboxylase [Chitinophagaceae bacterium]|nr:diaminopimelate decarboxylase [Chitinophagaceae bacterium]
MIATTQPARKEKQTDMELSGEFLANIANQYGTPLYVYHAEKIKEQFKRLTSAFEGADATFFYACKALTNINVLRYIRSIGCNIDCSSSNEVLLALHAGFSPRQILYTSNNISFAELEEVASKGVNINIDSISNLGKFGKKFGATYPVGVRLRPNILAGGNLKISTGHDASKFGIPLESINEIHDVVKETGVVIRGLHIHTGSDIKDVDVFVKGVEILFNLTEQFPQLEFLDLGGGFKVSYKDGDHETDIAELGRRLTESQKAFQQKSGRRLSLWFEPGKFLVSEAGYFISSVNVIKETSSVTFVGLNTGLNHLIRPMFYDAWHTIVNISNPGGATRRYTITGNICETDTFATNREINEIREGDYLVFRNAGAYCFEMSSNYNSRYKPAEVLIEGGNHRMIRRADKFDDLLRNQVL